MDMFNKISQLNICNYTNCLHSCTVQNISSLWKGDYKLEQASNILRTIIIYHLILLEKTSQCYLFCLLRFSYPSLFHFRKTKCFEAVVQINCIFPLWFVSNFPHIKLTPRLYPLTSVLKMHFVL